ncbi:hypothetical protein XFUD_11675 [Xylella fastidiosa]|nr:hypothetical protein XFUD_11675 [Xylella fastidiosa]ETE28956.1 hypothetical protein B398_12150 [Xylella fastidiosa 32]OJZ69328.1 hypothetical protein B375_0211040 [Xylella fastidiosa 6c]ALR02868.1 hypothetical protein OY18_12415 [Xylella fastidiosa]KXB11914.1 hypothetical protein ADT29_10780 [Xylella fastidiosa]
MGKPRKENLLSHPEITIFKYKQENFKRAIRHKNQSKSKDVLMPQNRYEGTLCGFALDINFTPYKFFITFPL